MKSSITKNAIYKIILNLFNIIVPILIGPYVFRILGPVSIGTVQFSQSIFNYFFIFASFGVYQYGLREMSRIKDDKAKASHLFSNLLTISVFTNIVMMSAYLLFVFIGLGEKSLFPVLLILSINFIANIFYVEWMNEAFERYDFITIKTIIVRLVYIALILTFIRNENNYLEYATFIVIITFLNNIISFVYIKRNINFKIDKKSIFKHIKPLFLLVIFSNANILYTQLDKIMIGSTLGEAFVSYYSLAQLIMIMISTLILSITQVTIPRLSYLVGNEDDNSYLVLLNNISKVYYAFLFPSAIGLCMVSELLVNIYGGAAYSSASPVLMIFSIYMISIGIESILSNQILYVKRKENILVKLTLLCGVINLICNIVMIKIDLFTPSTAILTTGIVNSLLIFLEHRYIRKHLKIDFKLFDIAKIKYLFYSLTFIPITYTINLYVTGIVTLFLLIIFVNALVYSFILFVTKDEVLFMFVNKMKVRLKR